MQQRIDELRSLGAERILLPEVPIERMRQHAVRIARRKAATLSRLGEPRRTVEIGCWLRLQLLEATDAVLMQTSRRIGQLWSQARRTVEDRALEQLKQYRTGVGEIIGALDDPALSDRDASSGRKCRPRCSRFARRLPAGARSRRSAHRWRQRPGRCACC